MQKCKYTAIGVKWSDKLNGNTYHSVKIIRHKDGTILYCPFTYGYGDQYRTTALIAMAKAKWLPVKYRDSDKHWIYEHENNYPILWVVSDGLKRDCIANGEI